MVETAGDQEAASQTSEQRADAGLLVIHGVGRHQQTTTLDAFVSPLLDRLAVEGEFVSTASTMLGDPHQPGGQFPGVRVRHRARGGERELLIVEAGWNEVFIQAGPGRISPWVATHSPQMVAELIRYHARGWPRFIGTALMLAAFVLTTVGIYARWPPAVVAVSFGIATLIALAMVWVWDFAEVRTISWRDRWQSIPGVFTLLVYQLQRALVLVVLMLGIVLFPVLVVVLRLISSLPFVNRMADGLLAGLEALFTTGGVADMFAIADDQVMAAAIHTRLSTALVELERGVAPGGTITVLGHSGGAPLAWWMLSNPAVEERQRVARYRYRLLTVGAALNWAKRGFTGYATPLTYPLVNAGKPGEQRTYWLNVFSTWDPVPHGGVRPSEFSGWTTWPDDRAPNRTVRNLGAPVPSEHGEYWRNQQEFVPALWRAVDPDSRWAAEEAGVYHQRWSNFRLALLSALVRTRMLIIALPIAALIAMFGGQRFIGTGAYHSAFTDYIADALRDALANVIGDDAVDGLLDALASSPVLAGIITIAVLTVVAYGLTDVYTNFFWRALGRRVEPLLPALGLNGTFAVLVAVLLWVPCLVALPAVLVARDVGWPAFPITVAAGFGLLAVELIWLARPGRPHHLGVPVLLVWVPTLVLLPALLAFFRLGWGAWITISTVNTIIGAFEVLWFFGCLHTLGELRSGARELRPSGRVFGMPIGRQQSPLPEMEDPPLARAPSPAPTDG